MSLRTSAIAGAACSRIRSASAPSAASMVVNPSRSRAWQASRHTPGSSSTTRMHAAVDRSEAGATPPTVRSGSGVGKRSPASALDDVRLHREVLRQAEPVELRGGTLVARFDPLPELPFVGSGERRGVLLGLVLEDRLDFEPQLLL